jgi:ArsR family transcriptional regulator
LHVTELSDAATLLKTLGNPARLAIVDQLRHGEQCVHELVDALDLPQPLVSQHLRVLRDQRLVTAERRGREMAYRISDHHVLHIVDDAIGHSREPALDPERP